MKNVVFNKRQLAIWGFVAILLLFSIVVLQDNDWVLFFVFVFVSLVGMFVSIASPLLFVFEKESVTIRYWFGFHEIIEWTKVKSIDKLPDVPDSVWLYNYCISTYGNTAGKKAFFTKSEIAANRKTKMLIRKYWRSGFEEQERVTRKKSRRK